MAGVGVKGDSCRRAAWKTRRLGGAGNYEKQGNMPSIGRILPVLPNFPKNRVVTRRRIGIRQASLREMFSRGLQTYGTNQVAAAAAYLL
jgi:hypothetical protein